MHLLVLEVQFSTLARGPLQKNPQLTSWQLVKMTCFNFGKHDTKRRSKLRLGPAQDGHLHFVHWIQSPEFQDASR